MLQEDAQSKWTHYYQNINGHSPRETTLKAIAFFAQEPTTQPRFAIDLGCGTGRDSFELLRNGWQVLTMDKEDEALGWLNFNGGAENELLETKQMGFEDIDFNDLYPDLINASASLPFCPKEYFDPTWQAIVNALKPEARFAGHFFGMNDTWAVKQMDDFPTLHHTLEQVHEFLKRFEIEYFVERDEPGTAVGGAPKNWHTYNIVAQKR